MTRESDDEMAIKLLHTADWHLGMRFPSFTVHEQKLTQQRLGTVRNILGVAERYDVDAVVVAGDVFDLPEPAETWWRPLVELLAEREWSSRKLVLLPGNHDPLTATSVWNNPQFLRALPPWVSVVDRDDFALPLGDDAIIHGVPCRRAAGQLDMAAKLPARTAGDERIRIALLHGQTFEMEGWAANFRIARDTAVARGFDYVALGDTHALRRYPPETSPMVYPGAPEPTRFGETEAGNIVLALFPRRRRAPTVLVEPVGHFRWHERECTSLDELRAVRAEDHRHSVLRLSLRMSVPAREYEEAERILRELEGDIAQPGVVAIPSFDRGGLVLDAREIMLELEDLPDQVREAARRLQAMIDAGDRPEIAQRALVHLYKLAHGTETNP
jgi:DNA repair exonuclease SbcCD nuclease subunit